MDIIFEKLQERNSRETIPFLPIYESYTCLLNLTDNLQNKCTAAERELENLRQQLQDAGSSANTGSAKGTSSTALNNSTAIQSAMKNEARLREKLESLEEQYDEKLKEVASTKSLLREAQTLNLTHEKNIAELTQELGLEKNANAHLRQQVNDAEANSNLMDDQNYKLKVAFRALQEENDKLKKQNSVYEERLVGEKGKVVDEMNELTDIIERLKAEIESLRKQPKANQQHDSSPLSWFGGLGSNSPKQTIENHGATSGSLVKSQDDIKIGTDIADVSTTPSSIHKTIAAHGVDGTCIRYDHHSGSSKMVVTASSESTVKVWDAATGQQRGIFRGTPGYAMTCCDISGTLVVGGGNDRSCRVWDRRNERMVRGSWILYNKKYSILMQALFFRNLIILQIHQLVGHQNKITCVRLFGDDKPSVITGSADHTLKIWDISRKTYRQNTTLTHTSTATCVDVAPDCTTVVTGHMDGGLRIWDLRSGQLTAEMSGMYDLHVCRRSKMDAHLNLSVLNRLSVLHEGGISSVQFKPNDRLQVLSSSVDSSLKLVDLRTGKSIHTFCHSNHATGQLWTGSIFSPDGRSVASASSSDGTILIWDTIDHSLKTKLENGHASGIVSVDWCKSDVGVQQIASLDRKGKMVFWV